MPAALVDNMESPDESPLSTSIEFTQPEHLNGRQDTFKPEPLRNRRTPTYAKARDVLPKKGAFRSSLEGIRPHLGTRSESKEKQKPTPKFPRISRPVELLKNEYDVVVIGSGYGGSVAASRMARARQSVCLLELGREKWRKLLPINIPKHLALLTCS